MDETKQPGISFDNIALVKEDFWRDYDVPANSRVNFKVGISTSQDGDNYFTQLTFNVSLTAEEKEVCKINTVWVGFFSVVDGHENMDINYYMKENSAALMFPFIREHIAAITQKAGIKPIYLPPINIRALLKKSEKQG